MRSSHATPGRLRPALATLAVAGGLLVCGPASPQGRDVPDGGAEPAGRPVAILQIGDSHTAADFLTGQVRRLLQAEFGDGGAGYVAPGKPRAGVRSSAMKIEASSGWSYQWLQNAKDDRSHFALSGFEATASKAGETLVYSAEKPVAWNTIEIETIAGPNGGTVEISLDGRVESEVSLQAATRGRLVVRLTPERVAVDRVQRIKVETKSDDPVTISGVAVRNRLSGVSVSAVGFPGATVDIVNRYDGDSFREEIGRFAPDIVVLAFGTNEGFNDNVDPGSYATGYRRVLGRVRRAAPNARVIIVGPANGNRLSPGCKGEAAKAVCQAGARGREPSVTGALSDADPAPDGKSCVWRAPPGLAKVRDAQRRIAQEEGLVFWDWSEVMPAECGAHEWTKASPPLMADDHIHMTIAGYRQSAERFAPVLRSVVTEVRGRGDAVPNP